MCVASAFNFRMSRFGDSSSVDSAKTVAIAKTAQIANPNPSL